MHRISHNQQPPTREVAEQNFLERVFVRSKSSYAVSSSFSCPPAFWEDGRWLLLCHETMQHELAENWDIKATVLYDQPPSFSTLLHSRTNMRLHSDIIQPLGLQDCVSYDNGISDLKGKHFEIALNLGKDDNSNRPPTGKS
ncbi:UDP-glycosyltransferase TURAN, partial [Cucurbita argyrosperma subsp. sororia]